MLTLIIIDLNRYFVGGFPCLFMGYFAGKLSYFSLL